MARGRQPGFVMPESHRLKIANSNILNALIEHAEGQREMSATQVQAGLGLLRKVLPDLGVVEIGGEVEVKHILPRPLTEEEWRAQHGAAE